MTLEFLVAVVFTCSLSAILALLVLVADAYLLDYGECAVTVNKDKEIKLEGGSSLLSAMMANKIFIPSACGGRGTCGLCKLKVLKGGGELLPTEEPHLTREEIDDNIRLSCQVKIRNDIEVQVPEHLLSVKEFRTTVEKIVDLDYDTKWLRLKLAKDDEIHFRAGQYIQFNAPAYGANPEPVYRAYSVASSPIDVRTIELVIRLVPKGICTTYIFEVLKEGDEVVLNGPYGEFYLRDTDAEIVFIAGGTGIAPIMAMLHDMKEKNIRRKATFFYGANSLKDLYLVDEMRRFEKDIPTFSYMPCLAHASPEGKWDGETGLVTQVLDRHLKDAENKEAYLCGSPGMIDAAIEVLHKKGFKDDIIFYDKFA